MVFARTTRPRAIVAVLAVALAGLGALTATTIPSSAAPTVPGGFADALVTAVGAPTALEFTPDGRLLVATQGGRLFVVRDGVIGSSPALDLSASVCTQSERGLLGVAVDPAFGSNGFVYVFYTAETGAGTCPGQVMPAPPNRVARFTLAPNDTIDPASQLVIFDGIPSFAGNHNGGDLAFGSDQKLYVSVGDGGCDHAGGGCAGSNDAARDRHVALGKILRINTDGTTPSDNPFASGTTNRCADDGFTDVGQHCPETFAWGFRNPFRMAFGPAGRLYVNDVGQSNWEEIDDVQAGADYGWNVREGHCANGSTTSCGAPPAGMTNPIHDYHRSTGCSSITGGAFVPDAVWPSEYRGDYLFADFVCGKIFRLEAVTGGYARLDFVTGLGSNSAVHLEFGPDRALYYTTYANGGEIRRITFDPTAPTTTTTAPAPSPYVSDLSPLSAANGYGPIERDRSNGGSGAGDGGPITLNGVAYPKGLGVHATSSVEYALAARYQQFSAQVGVDDECGSTGSVVFQVHLDGEKVYETPRVTGASATVPVSVDTTGRQTLRLVVTNGGDGTACDHADWADARLTDTTTTTSSSTTSTTSTSSSTTTTTGATTTTTTAPGSSAYLSDLNPVSATSGYGPYERDTSNGGNAAGDGHTITLNSVTYTKGLGVHAASNLTYALGSTHTTFTAAIGIDDECGSLGSVVFQVFLDGTKVYDSAKRTGASATIPLSISVAGKSQLKLTVTNAGDGTSCDHADWADARLTAGSSGTTSTTTTTSSASSSTTSSTTTTTVPGSAAYLSDLNPVSATSGYGPYERDTSNGGNAAGDGHTITLNGVAYPKGLGVHAASNLTYALGSAYTSFTAAIGVDDECGSFGSVVFQVFVDGVKIYDSAKRTGASATIPLSISVAGKSQLKLTVTNAGDGTSCDHADWADARLS